MSWIQKLYETYQSCSKGIPSDIPNPISHTTQMAHIEITIDEQGNFRRGRAKVLENKEEQKTLIPCTEESGTRSGRKPKNHPLCDKLQYIAGDFVKYGGKVTSGFQGKPAEPYESLLDILLKWKESEHSHSMVRAIYSYLKKGSVIADLVSDGVLPTTKGGTSVAESFEGHKKSASPIFRALPPGQVPMDAFVRFRVEGDGVETAAWESESLQKSWISFYNSLLNSEGFCVVTGEEKAKLADNHPAKLRHDADKAKLISSNDLTGYTFRGRFLTANQAVGVSFQVTQKAHSMLQWLIRRQAFRSGDQVFVSWAITGKQIPDPCANSWDFLGEGFQIDDAPVLQSSDVGQAFAFRFRKKLAGYKANIADTEDIVVMGLDSATPGRMAIIFYRELTGSEFLRRIEKWHSDFSWFQDFGKNKKFIGAPSPKDIAWCAYGKRVEGSSGSKLLNATIQRLLPSIIDGRLVPRDLVEQCVRRTSGRVGLEQWEFRKCLGIACSLYRGSNNERRYIMALEEDRVSRDYLYGRLLAVADQIELKALQLANENRGTTASRLMQRFSDMPLSTWKTIEEALKPYRDRIQARYPGLLHGYDELLDAIHSKMLIGDYVADGRLSGEYLLGYHCQKQWFRDHKRAKGQWVPKSVDDGENQEIDSEE